MKKVILGLPLLLLALAGCGGRQPEIHTGARTPAPVTVEEIEIAPVQTPESSTDTGTGTGVR